MWGESSAATILPSVAGLLPLRGQKKIKISAHDNEVVRFREIPNLAIRTLQQINANDVKRTRIQVRKTVNQFA